MEAVPGTAVVAPAGGTEGGGSLSVEVALAAGNGGCKFGDVAAVVEAAVVEAFGSSHFSACELIAFTSTLSCTEQQALINVVALLVPSGQLSSLPLPHHGDTV